MHNKYNAKKIAINGMTFDSIDEGNRYVDLKLLEYSGAIANLETQPEFTLFPITWVRGKKLNDIKYTADFRYREGDHIVVEEVKAVMTRDAAMRITIFQRQNPDIDFRLIRTLKKKRTAKVRRKNIISEA
jgi:hypothetical protein